MKLGNAMKKLCSYACSMLSWGLKCSYAFIY